MPALYNLYASAMKERITRMAIDGLGYGLIGEDTM